MSTILLYDISNEEFGIFLNNDNKYHFLAVSLWKKSKKNYELHVKL